MLDRHHLRHHLYADDMLGLIDSKVDCISQILDMFGNRINKVGKLCASKLLQLKPCKTESLWFSTVP
jgi:hypothetical protein